jgi:N-methylhydantoinase A
MLQTDVRHDLVRAYSADLDAQPDARLASLFDALEREAASRLLREGFEESETQISRALDIRYVGQQWDITVPVSQDLDPAAVRQDFDREHDRLFGHTQPGGAIEITKARVTGVGRLPTLSHNRRELTRRELKPTAHRKVWIDQRVGWRETPVYRGADLHPGHRLVGPAIIEEETTTALVGATDVLVVDVTGNYVLTLGEAHPAARKTAEAAE